MGKGGFLIHVGRLEIPIQLGIFVVCCIGPVLVVVGSVLVALAATPDRESAITSYNVAAEQFQTSTQEFQSTPFGLFGNYFMPVQEADELNDSGNFVAYPPFKLMLPNIPMDNITADQILIDVESPYLHQIYLGIVPTQRGFSLPQSALNCHDDSIPCSSGSCESQPLCSIKCTEQNGVWSRSSHTCAVTHYLNDICIKVSQASSSWLLDTGFGGSGCFYKGKRTADSEGNMDPSFDPWSPLLYLKTEIPEVNLTIRHASDPQVVASFLTFGSYQFGPTVEEKIVTGVVILAVGGGCLLFVPIAVFFFVKWLMKHERGVKKSYRNGGLEKLSSMDVKMQQKYFEQSHPPAPKSNFKPTTHIIDIYVSPQSQASSN